MLDIASYHTKCFDTANVLMRASECILAFKVIEVFLKTFFVYVIPETFNTV